MNTVWVSQAPSRAFSPNGADIQFISRKRRRCIN